ncbi:MAG: phytanoyl-CoA dioxygenase family protein [Massilia sp.]
MKYIQLESPLSANALRLCFYYLQRVVTIRALRAFAIALLRRCIGDQSRSDASGLAASGSALAALQVDGIASLGQLLSTAQCAEMLRFLADKQVVYRDGISFALDQRPPGVPFANHALHDLVRCPHILALANCPAILDLARHYLGCTPTVSGVSARWSFPTESVTEVVQQFHRDSEDWQAFRILVYLTDVDDDAGPHVYVKRTHLDDRTMRLPVLEDAVVEARFGDRLVRQTGAQGFGFAVDTAGLHKGEMPKTRPRLLLSFQYSILPCFLYEYQPVALAERSYDSYINRLIVK